jgi:hypothetical protein
LPETSLPLEQLVVLHLLDIAPMTTVEISSFAFNFESRSKDHTLTKEIVTELVDAGLIYKTNLWREGWLRWALTEQGRSFVA